jgi:EmrB/QacA subfamily drug resistance transporter
MTTDLTSRRVTLMAATLAAFLTPFMDSAANIALPSIGNELAMDAISFSWIRTAYLLATAMFLVPFARAADIHGRKRFFVYGMAIFSVAALLVGLATSATMLITTRVLQGIGSAMIFSTGVAILTSVFPPQERGQVLGLNVAAVYLGLSLGPTIGGLMTEQWGWRSIFFITAFLGLFVIIFVVWKLKGEWAEAQGETFDLAGSILYAISLLALMYGFSRLPNMLGVGLILGGILGLVAFVAREMRATHPVLSVRLFAGNRPFTFSNLAALINYSAVSATAFLLSNYLQYIKALTPRQAGLVLLAQPIVQALFSPIAGRLSDRIEPRLVASLGMMLTAVGLGLLAFLSANTPLWAIVGCLVVLGFGFALFSSPNMNAIMGSVQRRFYGVASGILGTMRIIGQTFSMGIVTLLLALYIGPVKIAPESYPAFLATTKTAFAIFTALCLGGIFASLARGTIQEEHESGD